MVGAQQPVVGHNDSRGSFIQRHNLPSRTQKDHGTGDETKRRLKTLVAALEVAKLKVDPVGAMNVRNQEPK